MKNKITYTETEILEQLDLAFNDKPSKYFPKGKKTDIKYNIFLDLEHGYFNTAGNKIHLYADSEKWAIVFEKNGYENRGTSAEIELNYFGNCINYITDSYKTNNYITNTKSITLIEPSEFERIENKEGLEMETFELIGNGIKEIKIRDLDYKFDNNHKNYEALGIQIRQEDNSNKLIAFEDLIRYLSETNAKIIDASEKDIREHINSNIPKIMTIENFHFISSYDKSKKPSEQETYQLIAKVLKTRDSTNWKPSLKPNNNWKNWESGNL